LWVLVSNSSAHFWADWEGKCHYSKTTLLIFMPFHLKKTIRLLSSLFAQDIHHLRFFFFTGMGFFHLRFSCTFSFLHLRFSCFSCALFFYFLSRLFFSFFFLTCDFYIQICAVFFLFIDLRLQHFTDLLSI